MPKKLLDEYNVPFDPNLTYENLSQTALIKLMKEYARSFLLIESMWFDAIEKRLGTEEARKIDFDIWRNLFVPSNVARIRQALNVKGDDVEALFKILQHVPDGCAGLIEGKFELKGPNYGTWTCYRCSGLLYWEKHRPDRIQYQCHVYEPIIEELYGLLVNPKMKCRALKLPPRKSPDDIPCIWEYSLER